MLGRGTLTLKDGGKVQAYFVAGGFAEVLNDKVMVLADLAEPVASIDAEAARKRLTAAQEKLRGITTLDPAYEATERRLAALPTIEVPTIILDGDVNGIAPPRPAADHARQVTGPLEYRRLAGVGHNVPQEAPRDFADAVLTALRSSA